ncbi:hypothetical protein MMC16_000430 [Acarospora aff. strigata]|nr:hypothetical protein [Acarospora aff. strigata]
MATSVDAKLLKQTKFPLEFSQKVDMKKVNVEVMKKWIAGKISEILGNEDDVVIELCFNLLEGARFPDIKVLQIQLTGFLDKDTARFCKELWTLCLSAQSNPQGVPKELLEAKKLELIQEKLQKKRVDARSRREFAIETLTISGNGNEESVAGDADAAAEEVEILTDVHPATHGLRPREDAAHLIATTTEDHRRDGRWTHISLAVVEGDIEMREDVAHHQLRDPSRAPDLHPPQPIAVGCAMIADHDMIDVGTGRTDHAHHLPDDKIPEGGEEGLQIVVITEQDPLLL